MRLIVGLGNPGDKFQYTRHNIGFMVVDRLVKDKLTLFRSLKAWKKEDKFSAEICKLDDLIIIKPQTYMNLSGLAVSRVANFYKIKTSDIWVVHDDIDLPVGKIRIRKGGASAGHHGVDSIIKSLGTDDFVRIRLGIGRGKLNINRTADQNLHRRGIEKFVLSLFNQQEGSELKHMIKKASEAIKIALQDGIEKAMSRFN